MSGFIKQRFGDTQSFCENGWIDIREQQPVFGQAVLVSIRDKEVLLYEYCPITFAFDEVSHWMELPVPVNSGLRS